MKSPVKNECKNLSVRETEHSIAGPEVGGGTLKQPTPNGFGELNIEDMVTKTIKYGYESPYPKTTTVAVSAHKTKVQTAQG